MNAEDAVTSPQDGPTPRWSIGSSSGLHYGSFANSLASLTPMAVEKPAISPRRAHLAVAVLCYLNLLNYMERYTIAGVLSNIQRFFNIRDSTAGLLQTVFICSFLLLAPLFGYLGDRYNRKYIMIGGLSVWLVTAAGSSLVTESLFWLLVLLRALVGIGEASYSTIAPTIIGDLFTGGQRSIMICVFYIFIPVGSGLGYIVGAGCANLTGDWRWALRITPILGLVGLFLLVFLCPNPARGAAETHGQGVAEQTSYKEDVKYLLKNKSYVWSSFGVTAMAFLTGALAFWMPTFLSRAQVTQKIRPPCTKEPCDSTDSYIFGAVTVVTGILGASLGTGLSRWLRNKVSNADPLICAVGMLGSAPCLFITIFVASESIPATYVFIFLGELLLSLNWAVLADILLYVVIPTRRATAEALQITVCHLLGDAGSPYLIGTISDAIRKVKPGTDEWSFHSLKYSLLVCPSVGILGGLFFLMTSRYITEDRKAAQELIAGAGNEGPPPQPNPAPEPSMELSNSNK
ncbi:protein spinster homolog 3-like [Seriola lalandi dorsalis]|uniref:SPNS lysolipid transporter 3, sphingosine-1-phosphate (putative) n=1 Tax=Seriola lalandi dorsalis TaxID=1841481 RepID=A0A3B4YAG4_SERLL|nr:protein spinster homolog 3-like [Seriola lalandi dorsalis]XP_056253822.1 protein spinster homolog 3 [Seriola aureovittata]XP_056253824.1 protein spinster homolog 3 [Seriola aureovittata]